jgi:adenosylcobinamide-phosphate synthase
MSGAASLYLALLCALAVDRWLGEPALRWHPVVWMGKYLGRTGDWVQQQTNQNPLQRDWKAFWLAALAWLLGAALVTAVAWLLQTVLSALTWWAAAPLLGVLLKPLLALGHAQDRGALCGGRVGAVAGRGARTPALAG